MLLDVNDLSDLVQPSSPEEKSRYNNRNRRDIRGSSRQVLTNYLEDSSIGLLQKVREFTISEKELNVNVPSFLSEGKIGIRDSSVQPNTDSNLQNPNRPWTPKHSNMQASHKKLKSIALYPTFSSKLELIKQNEDSAPDQTPKKQPLKEPVSSIKGEFESNDLRVRVLAIWKYFFNLISFSNLTTDRIRDTRQNDLLKRWIGLTEDLLCKLTKFGSDYSKTSSSKYERIDYIVISDMFIDKMKEVFVSLFLNEKLKKTEDHETNGRLLQAKSRLLQVYIILIVRVRSVPQEIIDMVIREINKDTELLFDILDECALYEPSLFVFRFRNGLKASKMLDMSKFKNKPRYLHWYLNPLGYSVFAERTLAFEEQFTLLTKQICFFFGSRKPLVRQKLGPVVTFVFVVFLEYLEIQTCFKGAKIEQKIEFIRERSSVKNIESGRKTPTRALFDSGFSNRSKIRKQKTIESLDFGGGESLEFQNSAGERELSEGGSLKGSIHDGISSRSNLNSLNDEFLKEGQYEEVVAHIGKITEFCFDLLNLQVLPDLIEQVGVQTIPLYIIMKVDLQAKFAAASSGGRESIAKVSQELFESFLQLVAHKEDLLLKSFKIGELLFYIFYLSIGCDLKSEVFSAFT